MLKERVKSLALFLLFALSIYLMKELWASDLILTLKNDYDSQTRIQNTAPYITPQTMVYSYGSGVYSAVFFDKYQLWPTIREHISMGLNQSPKIVEIDAESYERLKKSRSVELQFSYTLSLKDLLEILNSSQDISGSSVYVFDRILVPSGRGGMIYFSFENSYYALTLAGSTFSLDADILEAENSENTRFRTVEDIYRIKTVQSGSKDSFEANQQLIPLGSVPKLSGVKVKPEYNITDDGVLRDLVSRFFGTHIVKKLVDIDGSLVYLYGYGEKTLKVDEKGSIEFKSKLRNKRLQPVSLKEGLQYALSYIDSFGGIPRGLSLKAYHYGVRDGAPEYYFEFKNELSNLPLEDETGQVGIFVTLVGSQVIDYKRYIVQEVDVQEEPGQMGIQTIDTLINRNFMATLSPNYLNDHPLEVTEDKDEAMRLHIFDVLQSINSFSMAYYLDSEDANLLVPVWKVGFDAYNYYFDLSDGSILKTERKAD